MDAAILSLYFLVLSALAVFGLHRYWLVLLYFRHRDQVARPAARLGDLPSVLVQLPVFNEKYVVERLIDAVCRLDYPNHLLQIQVLDDSTDETVELAARRVRFHAQRGVRIEHLRRPSREGFKAGSLQHGLARTDAQLVAIFDADFVPAADSLRRMVDFFSDPRVGMVQLRWSHLNGDYSLLTKAQTVLLDGHFVLESGTRSRSGRFFNFNGTAGMWRRAAIEDAGGWQSDTLTEDLDLSYRAQLRGWKFVFLQDVLAPAEVPVDMNSFKTQQNRWAKGSIQTAFKVLPSIVRAPLSLAVKTEAFFHLTSNLAYPLMVALALLMLPALSIRLRQNWAGLFVVDLPLFLAATLSVSTFYLVSLREVRADWKSRIASVPLAMALGIGLSVSNGKAVLEGLLGRRSAFQRTPKFGIEGRGDVWRDKHYRAAGGWLPALEILLGLYFVYIIGLCLATGQYLSVPFLALFMAGYLLTGLASCLWRPSRPLPRSGNSEGGRFPWRRDSLGASPDRTSSGEIWQAWEPP